MLFSGDDVQKLFKYCQEKNFAGKYILVSFIPLDIFCNGGRRILAAETCGDVDHEIYLVPAINVTSSSVVVAALEAARDTKSPIVLQISQGGAAFFAGKGVANGNQEASIAGAVAGAHYIRSIAPSYGIPVVLHTDHCAKKLLPCSDSPHHV